MLQNILIGLISSIPLCMVGIWAWGAGRRLGRLEGYTEGSRDAWRDSARWAKAWRDDVRAKQTKTN